MAPELDSCLWLLFSYLPSLTPSQAPRFPPLALSLTLIGAGAAAALHGWLDCAASDRVDRVSKPLVNALVHLCTGVILWEQPSRRPSSIRPSYGNGQRDQV